MTQHTIFDIQVALPDARLSAKESSLLGFDSRYQKIHEQLGLLLNLGQLSEWSERYHQQKLALCNLITEQYPFVIFYGDVGTGKTATAECIANRLVKDSETEDSILFKLSNRVRGSGKVGEMGTLITQAFNEVAQSIGKNRRAILIIDEGDSLAASRSQDHSHHEDKVAVNTLIQCIDDLRRFNGRIIVFLCTNRLSTLDAALQRRAAIVEEFMRPDDEARQQLFNIDLTGMHLTDQQLKSLVKITGPQADQPGWTFSDIRTRLYPAAVARAFPHRPLTFDDLYQIASTLKASPVLEDK